MKLFSMLLTCWMILNMMSAEPPTWLTCAQLAAKISDGIFATTYTCGSNDPVGTGPDSVYFILQNKDKKKFTVKVSNYNTANEETMAKNEEKIFVKLAEQEGVATFVERKTTKIKNSSGQEVKLSLVFMEYAPFGTLDWFYQNNKSKFDDPRFLLQVILDVARALKEFHAEGFVYVDLRTVSCVVTEGYVVKLSDFTSTANFRASVHLRSPANYWDNRYSFNPVNYDQLADVYSLGLMVLDLFNGENPYKGANNLEILASVSAQKFSFKKSPEKTLAEIVVESMHPHDGYRLTIDQIISKIEAYLGSKEDKFITRTAYEIGKKVDWAKEEVTQTVSRQDQAAKYKDGTRYGRRLGEVQGKPEVLGGFLAVIWAISAVWVFLGFRAISRWVDGMITKKGIIEVKAEGAGVCAKNCPATPDIKVPIQTESA